MFRCVFANLLVHGQICCKQFNWGDTLRQVCYLPTMAFFSFHLCSADYAPKNCYSTLQWRLSPWEKSSQQWINNFLIQNEVWAPTHALRSVLPCPWVDCTEGWGMFISSCNTIFPRSPKLLNTSGVTAWNRRAIRMCHKTLIEQNCHMTPYVIWNWKLI